MKTLRSLWRRAITPPSILVAIEGNGVTRYNARVSLVKLVQLVIHRRFSIVVVGVGQEHEV
jgi:hypothetical protein